MTRQKYSAEVKAACIAALRLGSSPAEVAKQFNVLPATVRGWKSRLEPLNGPAPSPEVLAGMNPTERARAEEHERVRSLVMDYLMQGLESLREQAKTASQDDYLRGQSAHDVAILHGVLADKVVRILEAYNGLDAGSNAVAGAGGGTGAV